MAQDSSEVVRSVTIIKDCGFVIDQVGKYRLDDNLVCNNRNDGESGITIKLNALLYDGQQIDLDLNDKEIICNGKCSRKSNGITIISDKVNEEIEEMKESIIKIRHGCIKNFGKGISDTSYDILPSGTSSIVIDSIKLDSIMAVGIKSVGTCNKRSKHILIQNCSSVKSRGMKDIHLSELDKVKLVQNSFQKKALLRQNRHSEINKNTFHGIDSQVMISNTYDCDTTRAKGGTDEDMNTCCDVESMISHNNFEKAENAIQLLLKKKSQYMNELMYNIFEECKVGIKNDSVNLADWTVQENQFVNVLESAVIVKNAQTAVDEEVKDIDLTEETKLIVKENTFDSETFTGVLLLEEEEDNDTSSSSTAVIIDTRETNNANPADLQTEESSAEEEEEEEEEADPSPETVNSEEADVDPATTTEAFVEPKRNTNTATTTEIP